MQNTKVTLYFSKDSCAIASMAALEEAELRFDATPVGMSPDGAGDDAFRRLNPRRQVPVLTVGERIFRENGAIFRYLNDLRPQAGLLPIDSDEQIRASEWIGYLGGTVHPAFRLLFRPQRFVGFAAEAQQALRTETRSHVQKLLDELDAELTGDWVLRQLVGQVSSKRPFRIALPRTARASSSFPPWRVRLPVRRRPMPLPRLPRAHHRSY